MNTINYTASRNSIRNHFSQALPNRNDETINAQFNMTSASLLNYLPSIGFNQHEEIFKSILLYKKLSILEQSSYDVLDIVETENLKPETLAILRNKPSIICTFHTGSYRAINLFLIKKNIPFSLVMGKEVMEKEGEHFSTLYSQLPGKNNDDAFNIINAEAPHSGLQMLRELKKGRSLVLYIDGNSGAGNATIKNDNRCCVDFLNQQLFARKGIAWLAHAADVPIITVASYRPEWNIIRLRFFDPIYPAGKDRNAFATQTTQAIYGLVAPLISENPAQWEAWLYIHKVANIINSNVAIYDIDKSSIPARVNFNSSLFGIFKINKIPFLLKKNDYSFFEIDEELFDVLTANNLHSISKECIDQVVLNQLFEQGVLVNA